MSIWELFQLVEKQWRSRLAYLFGHPFFTSMRYLGLGLLLFFFFVLHVFLFEFSPAQSLLLPIFFSDAPVGRPLSGEIGGEQKDNC